MSECVSVRVCECVCLIVCDTVTSKRVSLSPCWAVCPQKITVFFHFYERTPLEVSYGPPYLFYQIGMKSIKIKLFSFG